MIIYWIEPVQEPKLITAAKKHDQDFIVAVSPHLTTLDYFEKEMSGDIAVTSSVVKSVETDSVSTNICSLSWQEPKEWTKWKSDDMFYVSLQDVSE